jgi:hypothetical protein
MAWLSGGVCLLKIISKKIDRGICLLCYVKGMSTHSNGLFRKQELEKDILMKKWININKEIA